MMNRYNNWVDVGNPGFTTGPARFSVLSVKNGNVYVAYADIANGNKATVMKYTGHQWVSVGQPGFSAGAVAYISMKIGTDGTPFVAYQDSTNANKATVMEFNGTTWVTTGNAGFTAGTSKYTDIGIDKNNNLYLVYQDGAQNNKITVMKYDGQTWEDLGQPGFSSGRASYTKVVLSETNTPYVIYQDGGDGSHAVVKKYEGHHWVNVGPSFPSGAVGVAGVAYHTSLAISNEGVPYAIYYLSLSNNNTFVPAVKVFDNSTGIANTGNQDNHGFTLFPNPTHGNFMIEGILPGNDKYVNLKVIDVSGKIIWQENIKTKNGKVDAPINLNPNLACGLYFIKIHSGTHNENLPIIKQ